MSISVLMLYIYSDILILYFSTVKDIRFFRSTIRNTDEKQTILEAFQLQCCKL